MGDPERAVEMFAFDIETDTTIDGLDPAVAEVVSIAVFGDSVSTVIDGGDEPSRLSRFVELLDGLDPALAVSWNGAVFDGPFLVERARVCGVELGFTLTPDPEITPKYAFVPGHCGYRMRLRRHAHLDVAYLYRDFALEHPDLGAARWSLKPVCAALGIPMVVVDRANLHELGADELAEYNLSDARGTFELARRLGPDIGASAARL